MKNDFIEHAAHKSILLTSKKAKSLLTFSSYDGQRPFKKWWSDYLIQQIDDGWFLGGNVAVLVDEHGVKYLIDGQHQCHAVVQSNHTVKVTYQEFKARAGCPEKAISKLFNTRNSGQPASFHDRLWACSRAWECLSPFNRTLITCMGSAICWYKAEFQAGRRSIQDAEDAVTLMAENTDCLLVFREIATGSKRQYGFLATTSVLSALYRTSIKYLDISLEFWRGVRTGAELSQNDARLRLLNWLRSTSLKTSRNEAADVATEREFHDKCIRCFNWFAEGREMKKVPKYDPKDIPEVITLVA